ncbi:hypothetical protein [Pseudomonas sp. EA_5y_Pfl2_R50]|uniref:hypothetical protein n=1 Tax=Pseudomonas sp. EA_5y_Pfl2_R50 TaxID=3088691 RepID=UPI0030DB0065
MKNSIMLAAVAMVAGIGNAHAQSLLCPKTDRIKQESAVEGDFSYSALAPNNGKWTSKTAGAIDLKTLQFTGAAINPTLLACNYRNQADVTLQLQLQVTDKVQPNSQSNWKDGECVSDKLSTCAFQTP